MAKPTRTHTLICTLTVSFTKENGRYPSQGQMTHASEFLRDAIQNRLFGEGFLPDDILVGDYDITID